MSLLIYCVGREAVSVGGFFQAGTANGGRPHDARQVVDVGNGTRLLATHLARIHASSDRDSGVLVGRHLFVSPRRIRQRVSDVCDRAPDLHRRLCLLLDRWTHEMKVVSSSGCLV
jgi:hypothetical protein